MILDPWRLPSELAVLSAWELLEHGRQRFSQLTGDQFVREMVGCWQAACFRVLGRLKAGEQHWVRRQLVRHLEAVATCLAQASSPRAMAMLPAVAFKKGLGKSRGLGFESVPPLLPWLRPLSPLLETSEACRAFEHFWLAVLKHLLARLPWGNQRVLLRQLDLHLTGICEVISRKKTPASVAMAALPRPTFTSQRGRGPWRYRDLRALANDYDRVLGTLSGMLSSQGLQEGQIIEGDPEKYESVQHLRAWLREAMASISGQKVPEQQIVAIILTTDHEGRVHLCRTRDLGLFILGKLYDIHPNSLSKTLLAQARRLAE